MSKRVLGITFFSVGNTVLIFL